MSEPIIPTDGSVRRLVMQRRGTEPGADALLGATVLPVLGENPDEVAAERDLARRSGLPTPIVRSDRERAEREAKLRELDLATLPQRAPATAEVLKDRELARVAHDDVRSMGLIERYVRDIGQRFERGKAVNELGPLGADALLGTLTGAEADEAREFRIRQLQGQMAAETDFGVDPGGVPGFFTGIPGAAAEALPMMASGVVASSEAGLVGGAGGAAVGGGLGLLGGPVAPASVPAGAAAGFTEGYATGATLGLYVHSAWMEAGYSFVELRGITDESGQPIDPKLAAGLSLAVGAAAGGVEMFALGKLLEKVPGARQLTGAGWRAAAKQAAGNPSFRRFAGQLAISASGSAATEGLTEGVQELIAIGGEIAGLAATGQGIEAFRFEAPGPDGQPIELTGTDAILARVMSATSQGAQMGAGIAAGGRTAQLVTDSERAKATLAKLPGLDRLQKATTESKLLQRDPEAFKRHVREVAAQTGVEAVYVEPQAFREFFESIDPEQVQTLFEEIPALREQQEEIARTGADVRIRLEDWYSHPEMAEALREHVRFDPLDMTAKEALGFEDDLEREVGSVQELVEGAREGQSVRAAVEAEVRAQLLKVYPETVVAPMVELTLSRMETRAQRTGKTLQTLVAEEGVFRVQGPQDAAAPEKTGVLPPTLEDRLGRLRDEGAVRQVLADMRAGRLPELTRGTPIVDLLRSLGGVRTDSVLAGELKSMGFVRSGKGSFRGLISDKGRVDPFTKLRRDPIGDVDNIVADEFPELAAVTGVDPETGYLDRQGVLNELARELRGESGVLDPDEQAARRDAEETQAAIREALEAAGLDLEADDDAIVAAVRGRTFEQPAYHGTPHRFDRFDITKIGTGEGAQVYGWGLYFSSEKGIADFYRQSLAYGAIVREFSRELPPDADFEEALDAADEMAPERARVIRALAADDWLGFDFPAQAITAAFKNLENYDPSPELVAAVEAAKGQVYEVEIPDDENLLDWEKPLSEQHPAVHEKLEPFLDEWMDNRDNPDGAQRTMSSWVEAIAGGTLTGEQVYKGLTRGGRDEVASKRLLEAGILGHRYRAGKIAGKHSDATNFVIYDDKAIQVARTFYEANRGAIRMNDDLSDVVIRFTEAADLSTFLHESGHLWLAQLAKDAASDEGQLDADLATVKEWARDRVGTDDIDSDAVQELWARSIEAYFFEGKAPTVALERVFARFSAWLIRIYKRLRGIPGYNDALTPEIRQVMDRLIATDEQIAESAAARGLQEIDAKSLGMTEAQADEYRRTVAEGRAEAQRRLLPQLMEQVRRQATKEWKALREGVRAEVEADVNARPVFRAQHWIRTGKALEGQPIPIAPHLKLDRASLVELYGKEIVKVLPGLVQKDGYHPDQVAELFGFQTGDDLVRSLAAAGRRQEVIEQETEAETLRRHGKPETRDDLEAKALEALTNQKQIKALLLALRQVATKTGGKVIPIAIARATAERIVRGTRYRDLNPSRYRAAALKASREAVKLIAKGNYPEAQRALRLQINNLLMESEARKAIAEADRGIDYLNNVQSRKSRERIGKAGADYLEQIEGLLERFNLKKHQSLKKIDKLHGLAAWIEKQKEAGEGVAIDPKLANEAFKQSWKELSINDMLALTDAVKNIEHLARLKNKFTASRDQRRVEDVRAELVAAVEKNAIGREAPDTINPRKGYAIKTALLSWDAPIRKIQSIIDFLDGGDPNGPWRRYVMDPVNDVTNDRLELTKKHLEPFGQAIRDHIKPRLKEYTADFYSPELGLRVNRLEVLTLMLNWGSPENVQRIVDGNKFSEAAVKALIDRVATKEDWEFVKKSWGIVAGLKSMLYEDAKKASGLTPKDAETRTIQTPFGEIEGKYFPIVYDPAKSLHTQEQAEKALMAGIETGFSAVANLPGSSIERANKVMNKPILLDLSVLPAHVDEIITKTTGRDRLTQVYKVLRHEDVRKALIGTTLGEDYYKLFEGWLKDIAADRVIDSRVLGRWEKILRTYRLGYSVSKLAIRETTLAGQVLGNFNAAGLLADKLPNWRQHMIGGWKKAYGGFNPKRSWAVAKDVMEASVFMRNRLATRDREVQEIRRQTIGDLATMPGKVKELAHKSADVAMSTIGWMQFLGVDLPVWLGAYNGAIAELDMTHDAAVRFADSIIEMSQGGGAIKDLSAIQRGGEMLKALTVFGGYTNTAYNQNANAIRTGNATRNPWRAIRGVMFAFFIPVFGYAAIREILTGRGGPPDEAEDWTDYLLWAIGTTLTETMNLIPILREGSSVPSALLGGGRYFDGTQPLEDFFEGLYDLATPQDAQEFAFDVVKFISPWLGGMPPDRPVDAIEKMVREE